MKETASTIDLSQTLERIDIDSAAGASTSITLSSGDRSQVVRFMLIGCPAPNLFGRRVCFTRNRSSDDSKSHAPLDLSDLVMETGALTRASLELVEDERVLAIEWWGTKGRTFLRWRSPNFTVEHGDAIEGHPDWFEDWNGEVERGWRSSLEGWTPEPEPRLTTMEKFHNGFCEERPAREILGFGDGLADPCEILATQRWAIVLEAAAKLARYRVRIEPCEHTRPTDLYRFITQQLIPSEQVAIDYIPSGLISLPMYSGCTDCAIHVERDFGYEQAWPPEEERKSNLLLFDRSAKGE